MAGHEQLQIEAPQISMEPWGYDSVKKAGVVSSCMVK